MSIEGGMKGNQRRLVCPNCGKVFFAWRPDENPAVKIKCYFCRHEFADEAALREFPPPPGEPAPSPSEGGGQGLPAEASSSAKASEDESSSAKASEHESAKAGLPADASAKAGEGPAPPTSDDPKPPA